LGGRYHPPRGLGPAESYHTGVIALGGKKREAAKLVAYDAVASSRDFRN